MSSPLKTVVRRMRVYVRPEEIKLEIDEELQFHIETRAQDNLSTGMSPEEAQAAALKQFGDYDKVKQDCYAAGAITSLNKTGLRSVAPFALMFLGLALMVWNMSHPYDNLRGLLFALLAVFITFISFISIPGCFRRSPIEQRGSILGLVEEGRSISIPTFHDEKGKSPLERALEDQ